jgi:hypothetical protein
MRILNLDRRYANYPRYQHALQFRGRSVRQITRCEERKQYDKVFEKLYGPSKMKNPDYIPGTTHWSYQYIDNPQWMFDKKHNRIYYQDEAVLSMVLLMLNTVT